MRLHLIRAGHYADFLLGIRPHQDFYYDPLGQAAGSVPSAEDIFAMQSDPFCVGPELSTQDFVSDGTDLTSPPAPPVCVAADLVGIRQRVRETGGQAPILRDIDEEIEQMTGGLQTHVNYFYEILIQYHLDKKLRRLQRPESLARAKLLSQRRVPLNKVIIFSSPTEDQQQEWAQKLKEPRWQNVPRLVLLNRMEVGNWITHEPFRSQIDLVRLDPLLPGAQPVAFHAKQLMIVGTAMMDGKELGEWLRLWRHAFVKGNARLDAAILDFTVLTPHSYPLLEEVRAGWESLSTSLGEERPALYVHFDEK